MKARRTRGREDDEGARRGRPESRSDADRPTAYEDESVEKYSVFPGRVFDRWTNQNAPSSANTAANRANFATHV